LHSPRDAQNSQFSLKSSRAIVNITLKLRSMQIIVERQEIRSMMIV
jgi:hypothetical protein